MRLREMFNEGIKRVLANGERKFIKVAANRPQAAMGKKRRASALGDKPEETEVVIPHQQDESISPVFGERNQFLHH